MTPGANPVTGLPSCTAPCPAAEAKSLPAAAAAAAAANCGVVLECVAPEAAQPARKVVGPTGAVPVAGPDVRARAESEGTAAAGAGFPTALAGVAATEVEAVARSAIPVSPLPIHLNSRSQPDLSINAGDQSIIRLIIYN